MGVFDHATGIDRTLQLLAVDFGEFLVHGPVIWMEYVECGVLVVLFPVVEVRKEARIQAGNVNVVCFLCFFDGRTPPFPYDSFWFDLRNVEDQVICSDIIGQAAIGYVYPTAIVEISSLPPSLWLIRVFDFECILAEQIY